MELIKKNIHLDRIKCRASSQITLEDDRNVPDQKPDMERILFKRGRVEIDEWKTSEDHVTVKGRLQFSILYMTEDGYVSRMDGEIPFDEQIYMEGIGNGDTVEIQTELEDLKIEMINSRKLSLHALLSLSLCAPELYEEELATELYHEGAVETKKSLLSLTEVAIVKKDIVRLKQEMEMPQSYPNIFEILWEDAEPAGITFEAMDGEIRMQGELRVFLLYEGEGDEKNLHCFEKVIPFQEMLECQGCREGMIPEISCQVSHNEIEVRADFDGEDRVACLELAFDLDMKLYEQEQIETLTDVYGIENDVQVIRGQGSFNRELIRAFGKTKLAEQVKLPAGEEGIVEICHADGTVRVEETQYTENAAIIVGTLFLTVLYQGGEERLFSFSTELPFSYELEAANVTQACCHRLTAALEQLAVTRLAADELDVKAVLSFALTAICSSQEEVIKEVTASEGDAADRKAMPGIVVHIARANEELWGLGKKYYVPLQRLRELNHLSSDTLKEGEKILIVR